MEEMHANYALNGKLRYSRYLFNKWIDKDANTLQNLSSGNITHKILQTIDPHEAIGPIHILQHDSTVREIINITAIAVINAQASSNQEH